MPRDPSRGAGGPRPRSSRRAQRAAPPRSSARGFSLHGSPSVSQTEARIETRLAWAAIAVFGVLLLVAALGHHRIGDYFAETDFYGDYARGAGLIQHGRLIATRYGVVGPVYEMTLALAGFAIRDLFLAARLLSIGAAVASLLLWLGLLARRADTRVALCAVLLMATNSYFFRYGQSATTDTLANALQAGSLFVLLTGAGGRAAAAAGLLGALAFLTRYNAVALLPAGLLAILAGGSLHARRGRAAWGFTSGFFALVIPWVVYSLAHGAAFSSQLHHNIAYEVFAHARGITWDEYQHKLQPQFHNLWQVIARDPAAVAGRMLFNVADHLRLDARNLLGPPVAAAAVLGLAFGAFDGSLRRLWPVWAAGGLLFLTLVPAFHSERYSLALLPVYAALAALTFASPRLALALGRRGRVWLKPALALVPLALAAQRAVRDQARFVDQLPVEVLECADSLRALARPGDRIVTRKPHVATIAGVDPVAFPFTNTVPELADYAHRNGARWLFVSWPEVESRPQYWYLLDTAAVVPGLTPRAVTRPHPAVLYEIGPGFGATPAWFANDTLRSMYTARGQLLVDGTNTRALFALGVIERARGQLEEARALFERNATLEPRNARPLVLLGDVLLAQGNAADGSRVFERALDLEPGNVDARVGRGWASLMAGRNDEAGRWWRPVVGATRDPATLQQMVKLYRGLGDPEAAAAAAAGLERLRGAR